MLKRSRSAPELKKHSHKRKHDFVGESDSFTTPSSSSQKRTKARAYSPLTPIEFKTPDIPAPRPQQVEPDNDRKRFHFDREKYPKHVFNDFHEWALIQSPITKTKETCNAGLRCIRQLAAYVWTDGDVTTCEDVLKRGHELIDHDALTMFNQKATDCGIKAGTM